jgi:hypothetical protein
MNTVYVAIVAFLAGFVLAWWYRPKQLLRGLQRYIRENPVD